MRVSYEWLKEFVDFDLDYEELIRELTLVGLECDPAPPPELDFEKIVAGKITECTPAGKGTNLLVDVGGETLPIYCGAPGLEVGQLVPIALVGGTVSGKKIEPAEFSGNKSMGMACSEAELGLGPHSASLMILDEKEIKPGDDLAEYLLAFRGIEIELTANRTDCWSFLGVAREIGAICGTQVKPLELNEDLKVIGAKDDNIEVRIENPKLAGAYCGLLFPEVNVRPSPLSVVRKLLSIGLRPINNIVDITNIVLYETGQPSHAFDNTLIEGGFIEVRNAKPGEKIVTLDDVERPLLTSDLVIADGSRAVALAGVMGGHSSEITFDTKSIFLENAHFDPVSIRRTSRRLGLRTDASIRFERGIDPLGIRRSALRMAWWVDHLDAGKYAGHLVEVSTLDDKPKKVRLRTSRMEKILGYKMDDDRVDEILNGLGFEFEHKGDDREVTVPLFRLDVNIEEDLVEEVARHFRYDKLPAELPPVHMKPVQMNPDYAAARHFKNSLAALGLWEVGTYSTGKEGFIDMPNPIDPDAKPLRFINPLTEDHAMLRTHLLPSLLGVMQHNLRHGVEPRDIFEISSVFADLGGSGFERYSQFRQIGILSLTKRAKGKKRADAELAGFLHVKGIVEGFIGSFGGSITGWTDALSTNDYPAMVKIDAENSPWGYIGNISDTFLDKLDIPHQAHFALLDFAKARDIYFAGRKTVKYTSLEKFPSITRDLALVVGEDVVYGDLEACIDETGGELLREVKLFDIFRSEKIGAGLKQLAVSLRFNHPERTLRDEEVNESIDSILKQASEKFDAKLRGW